MPLSLIHLLATRARHADTLKRALSGDAAACRLLALLGVTPLDLEAIARARTARRAAAWGAPQPVDVPVDMKQIRDLLGVHSNDGVPDAIRALRNRAEFAEAASEHGPITDLLAMGCWRISVQRVGDWYITQADRVGARPVGTTENATTVRQALLVLRERVKTYLPPYLPQNTVGPTQHEDENGMATLPARPSEPIVLGPWQELLTGWSIWHRKIVGADRDGLQVGTDGWGGGLYPDRHDKTGPETGEEGRAAADKWARENGYVLIDAEPGSRSDDTLQAPYTINDSRVWCGDHVVVSVSLSGWRILRPAPNRGTPTTELAHGPQVGEEGKRYALAAAHALGLTGGEE